MTTREENGMEGTVVQSKRSDIEIIANLLAIVLAFVEVVLVFAGHNVMKGRTFVPLWEILAFGIPALAFVVLFDILTYILRYRYDHDHREMILFADSLIIRNRSGVPQLIPTERRAAADPHGADHKDPSQFVGGIVHLGQWLGVQIAGPG